MIDKTTDEVLETKPKAIVATLVLIALDGAFAWTMHQRIVIIWVGSFFSNRGH
jgi:hypothetical protein